MIETKTKEGSKVEDTIRDLSGIPELKFNQFPDPAVLINTLLSHLKITISSEFLKKSTFKSLYLSTKLTHFEYEIKEKIYLTEHFTIDSINIKVTKRDNKTPDIAILAGWNKFILLGAYIDSQLHFYGVLKNY